MAPPLATHSQLERFTGVAPLFPLPSVALFPHSVRPLHVFEERYRILTEHALQSQRLMAMAVLQPGWECGYERNDLPLDPVVCLAQVEIDHRLPRGPGPAVARVRVRAREDAAQAAPAPRLLHEQHDVATQHPHVVGDATAKLDAWLDDMKRSATHPTDPMQTVLDEGGPYHTRNQLPAYLKRLRATDRARWADVLAAKLPG